VLDKFHFDTREVGAIWMVVGGVMILSQGFLTGLLTKHIGEIKVVQIGLFVGSVGFVALLLADGFISILFAAGFFMLAVAIIGPALNSYLSIFGGEHQGAMMGLNTAFASLGRVFGPLWAGFIFDVDLQYPFISGAVTLFIGFGLSLLGLRAAHAKQTGSMPIPKGIG
ncbi:MAG: MFS transporter, partial [Anaerolineaceae bacterium]|nr:MFS transporter [Anaerolineaceae bacterium]